MYLYFALDVLTIMYFKSLHIHLLKVAHPENLPMVKQRPTTT